MIDYRVGQCVRYSPTAFTTGWTYEDPIYGLKKGHCYRIRRVDNGYLFFYEGDAGLHQSNFELMDPALPVTVDEPIPFPDKEERVMERLERSGFTVGSKIRFNPRSIDRAVIEALGEKRLKPGEIYTIREFDEEAIGCFLKEIQGGLAGRQGSGFPVGWFEKSEGQAKGS